MLYNSMLLQNDPILILCIDSLLCNALKSQYTMSIERKNVLLYLLESERINKTILTYHPLRQLEIFEKVKMLKQNIKKNKLNDSTLLQRCSCKNTGY